MVTGQYIQRFNLQSGELVLTTSTHPDNNIFRVAERINPKRAFLFVSTILGRHIPVDPIKHREALRQLAQGVSSHLLEGPVFVMGFAETAVGIGAGVFDCLRLAHPQRDMGYLTTTRFPAAGITPWFCIEEEHSHAVDHTILRPHADVLQQGPDATLVLVDDETTTGKTFSELAHALAAQSLCFGRVVLVSLTDWSDAAAESALSGIFGNVDVVSVSLQKGSWTWNARQDHTARSLPPACAAHRTAWISDASQPLCAPRMGIASTKVRQSGEDILKHLVLHGLKIPEHRQSVLVVGAGEHVWQPMLAAEALAEKGMHVRFITTTRSPILQGDTIREKMIFPDHYGQGFYMYMHNVSPSDWDRILLFNESGVEGISDELVQELVQVDIIDGQGNCTVVSASRRTQ
jgi:hypothetical protein